MHLGQREKEQASISTAKFDAFFLKNAPPSVHNRPLYRRSGSEWRNIMKHVLQWLATVLVVLATGTAMAQPTEFFDISGDTNLQPQSRFAFDRITRTSFIDIAVANVGATNYDGPVRVVITGFTPNNIGVAVNNADGVDGDGNPFFEYDGVQEFNSGDTTPSKTWVFDNPNLRRFRFDFTVQAVQDLVVPLPPTAEAGPDQTVETGSVVALSGSATAGTPPYMFNWSFSSVPAGSTASITGADTAGPSFTADVDGQYTVLLLVTDDAGETDVDSVFITASTSVMNQAPTAEAGPNQTGNINTTVPLDGSASSDPEGDPLTYFWSLNLPAGSTATLDDPTLVSPSFVPDVLGQYVADLVVNDGNLDSLADSVLIDIINREPTANAGLDQTAFVTDVVGLDGSASSDPDGDGLTFSWSLSTPAGSTASLDDSTSVTPGFTIDVFGDYTATLVVNDGIADSAPDDVVISTLNSAPVADAGPDQTGFVTNDVMLDGTASSDVDGDEITYRWSLTTPQDSAAVLDDAFSPTPMFTIDLPGTYTAQLIVNDGLLDSDPDEVVVTTLNTAPVAEAGPNQSALVGDTAILNGSGSSDVDGDDLTFFWSITSAPADSTSTLSDATAVMPSLDIDVFGTYVVQLIVNDGLADSLADTVTISTENTPPTAEAGPDQIVFVGDPVVLDGSGSSDVDGNMLTFDWSIISAPAGSSASLSDADTVMPGFTVDAAGSYIVQLIVNDGLVDSTADTVTISTENRAPTADAGMDQSAAFGDLVSLNGTASFDPDGDAINYTWSIITAPAGSTATLTDANTPTPGFTIDESGDFVVQLIVNDGVLDSAPDTVLISSANTPPVAEAGSGQTVSVGTLVTLDGSASSDAENDSLTFFWSIISAPEGSSADLNDATLSMPAFTPDEFGLYVVQLIVNDGEFDSTPDSVVIQVDPLGTLSFGSDPISLLTLDRVVVPLNLSVPAPVGGLTVQLSSASSTAFVPTSVVIPENTTTVDVPVGSGDVAGQTTITADSAGFQGAAAAVTVTNRGFTISLDDALLGVTRTLGGQVTLADPAPAGGVQITLSVDNNNAQLASSLLTINEGETVGTFSLLGITAGPEILRAQAAGYNDEQLSFDVTNSLISLGSVVLGPGQNTTLGLSINNDAPAGGLIVTLTSSDENIATVPLTVVIPEGRRIPAANPQVNALNFGSATVTAQAPGFAQGVADVDVQGNFSFAPATVEIFPGASNTIDIELDFPAPSGGVVVDLSLADPSVATIPTQVTIPPGQLRNTITLNAQTTGTTTLTASAPFITSATAQVTTLPLQNFVGPGSDLLVGANLQTSLSFRTNVALPADVDVTVTSSDVNIISLGTSDTDLGGASQIYTFTPADTFRSQSVFFHAVGSAGQNATITFSAPGFNDSAITVFVTPSGFSFFNSNFSTTTFSANTDIFVQANRLNDSLNNAGRQNLRAGLNAAVALTNSNPAAGVLTSATATVPAGEDFNPSDDVELDPLSAGETTIGLVQPAGFSTPANLRTQITATVTAPSIVGPSGNVLVGANLQTSLGFRTNEPLQADTDVTVTSSDVNIISLGTSDTDLGGASQVYTFTPANTFSSQTVFFHALGSAGQNATITFSAPGFNDTTITVLVTPSGFSFFNSNFNTTTFSANTDIFVQANRLNDSLNNAGRQNLRAGLDAAVMLTNSNPAAGVLTSATATVPAGEDFNPSDDVELDPLNAGETIIGLVQPAGFSTPANLRTQITATVTAPSIVGPNPNVTSLVGANLQAAQGFRTNEPLPADTDVTVTTSDVNVISLGTSDTDLGGASQVYTFTPANTFSNQLVFFHAVGSAGQNATITFSAPGFNDTSITVLVTPSGFSFFSSDLNTTTFSPNTDFFVQANRLNDALINQGRQSVRAGLNAAVALTNSNPTAGVLTSATATVPAGEDFNPSNDVEFDPEGLGSTVIGLVQPAGFSTPANLRTQLDVEVRLPNIIATDNVTVTVGQESTAGVRLEVAPPSPVNITVTSSAPAAVTVSNVSGPGSGTTSFNGVNNTTNRTLFIQGIAPGSAAITVSAPGYADDTIIVDVN
jgi:hypothetical protein